MCRLLIFGGTTEGREIAEYCCETGVSAAVSVATEYGGTLLPESEKLLIKVGRLDQKGMESLFAELKCAAVIDATHPYAQEATRTIRAACKAANMQYYRLIRECGDTAGCTLVDDMEQLVELLNESDKTVLSTLGSKELPMLRKVRDFGKRLWLRALPSDEIRKLCVEFGFAEEKLILEKGPFTLAQNIAHIRRCGAKLLLTKESGDVGGFAEKKEAAKQCGAEVIVLRRPVELGYTLAELRSVIDEMR